MAKKTPPKSTEETPQEEKPTEEKEVFACGLVMPISEIDGCSEAHWESVKKIIIESLDCDYLNTSLVSDSDESGIIHNRIIQNLYTNPIVVCDVSGKNPNVMFELGMRLAFDMPTVVVKDDVTKYSFDTSPIEHVPYPRDLNYPGIVKFMKALRKKVDATIEKKKANDNYSSFLGNYQIEKVAKIKTTEITSTDFFIEKLEELSDKMDRINRQMRPLQREPIKRRMGLETEKSKSPKITKIFDFSKKYDVLTPELIRLNMTGGQLSDLVQENNYLAFDAGDGMIRLIRNSTSKGDF
ncbi:hypothetical protein [Gimesia maris]|uniref:RNA helicase n=1 Tax=Gimesia maris TaxID=122 RepID=A0ABX5YP45_9PLAN|nr:hypothetical protein [Gimesia maris]EDL58374.1 hypothetical protein PM8797T_27000 [Gimesia maris DSM 8797]QEG17531.1 hypothetical protein GmarT_34130 [Gimesia maris]QGQ29405.1 RNA helicase [Gimesia maris]